MSPSEFLVEYADSIAFQQRLVADMVCSNANGKSLSDPVMVDRRTGEELNRGTMYDRHAMTLCVMYELETGVRLQ